MLTEDDVIEAICLYLGSQNYEIVSRCATTERGQDIVAKKTDGSILRIEAKGETSNRKSSRRYGKPFTSAQCRDHVANAFFSASEMMNAAHTEVLERVGIAFADTPHHRKYVGRIERALDTLGINVFWVKANRTVTVSGKREFRALPSNQIRLTGRRPVWNSQ